MYDEDKQDDTIEIINENIKNNEIDSIKQENETLKKMLETRNAELNKPKEVAEDKIQVLSNALGLNKINERLDELNKNDNYLVNEMSKIVQAINQLGQNLQGGQVIPQGETPAIGNPLQKMEMLSGLFDKGLQLYQTFKSNQTPVSAPALINQDFINQRMVESFMEDLDTGKSISTFIKNSLKKTASKNIVNTALKDIGTDNDSSEPA